jgi:hypothetical protein
MKEAALAEVRRLRHQGHTLHAIAAKLGLATARDAVWRLESVVRVLKQSPNVARRDITGPDGAVDDSSAIHLPSGPQAAQGQRG